MRRILKMNDFTKEELQYLYQAIYERPNTVTEEMDKMRDKIQSMIDNYCEHSPSRKHPPQVFSMDGPKILEWEIRCDKCMRVYYDNQ